MKRLLIFSFPLLLMVAAFIPGLAFKVTGKISDAQGKPLAGVIITPTGSTEGTISAADGSYTIEIAGSKETLSYSLVGYDTKKEKVAGRAVINVSLIAGKHALQEVISSAYGSSTKKSRAPGTAYSQSDMVLEQVSPAPIDRRGYFNKDEESNTEEYDHISENRFLKTTDNPLSTFSIDVDAASYSNVRRYLNNGQLPPAGAVRIEEMINYFHYNYEAPHDTNPFSITTELATCPWNTAHKLAMIGLQGKKIPVEHLASSNLVFLIDVSGSMQEPNKLPLVQASMKLLVDQLREQDRVAIVVYAGAAGLVLPSVSGIEKTKIKNAIDQLEAGGSTAGGAGIELAYKTATENFVKNGNNRIILCTDGDFNVGVSSDDAMERLIEDKRKTGVFLTVLGYGMANYKDSKMQKLADKGNGNHAYIDGIGEAKKVLVSEFGGTLFTIAKDVKLQVEFNPAKVQGYRLVGYENRMLQKEDFNNDKKDAGDMGSAHSVTAFYEIIPAGVPTDELTSVDPLRYQHPTPVPDKVRQGRELLNIKVRYKQPDGDNSRLIEQAVFDDNLPIGKTSDNFRFAASVAQFGLLLRNSDFKSNASLDNVLKMAMQSKGGDEEGYRSEFIQLVKAAKALGLPGTSPLDPSSTGPSR